MIRHKFNAKKTELDGIKFDSKLEETICSECLEPCNIKPLDNSISYNLELTGLRIKKKKPGETK
jgi:hypothetical protein